MALASSQSPFVPTLQASRSTPLPQRRKPAQLLPTPPLPPLPSPSITTITSSSSTTTSLAKRKAVQKSYSFSTRLDVLREPRLHQTFDYISNNEHAKLRSHRVGYAEYGPTDGHAVFVIGGYGCSRLVGIMFEEMAYRYGLRMIWPERPGYGLSDDCSSQDINALDWADVIIQLANHVHIQRFGIIAQSVGTVFALAVAYKYPNRVLGPIYLISPWVSTQAANTFKWTRRLPAPLVAKTISLALDVMWVFSKGGKADDASSTQESQQVQHKKKPAVRHTMIAFEEDELLASLDDGPQDLPTDFPPDRPLRHFVRPKQMSLYLAMNKRRMAEPYNQGQLGDVMVALEKYNMFGFNYSDIKTSISAVWGDKDGLIPQKAIEILANNVHDLRLKILESEGHDLVWKEGVMEWAIRGISEKLRRR